MKKFFMFFILSFVLVLGACDNGDDDADTTDDAEEDADTEEVVDEEEATEDEEAEEEEATDEEEEADDSASTSDFDAEEFARTNCAACHGQDFTGGMGPDLTGLDEGTITDAVREGPGPMPSYSEDQISDEDLDVLAGFFSEM